VPVPGRVGGRLLLTPEDAPSVTSESTTPTEPSKGPRRLRTVPSPPEDCHKHRLSGCVFCAPPVRAATRNATAAEVAAARADLDGALEFAREVGATVPCLGPDGLCWTSDEVQDQEHAATLCADCPLAAQCGTYARLARESAGVWGGQIHGASRRNPRGSEADKPGPTSKRPPGKDMACRCGCLGQTRGGWYLPGHDSIHIKRSVAGVLRGHVSLSIVLRDLSHSPRLKAKLKRQLNAGQRRNIQ